MDLTPNLERIFHLRAVGIMAVLSVVDSIMITYAYYSLLSTGPSMQLMFGFEVTIYVCFI